MKFEIPAHMLRAAMTCQAPKDEIRYYLKGVLFTTEGDIVSTNGHVLFKGRADFKIEEDIILNIAKAPTKAVQNVEIDTHAKIAKYVKNSGADYSDLSIVDGKFPDWTRVIPADTELAEVDRIGVQTQYMALPLKAFGEGPAEWKFYGKERAARVTPQDGNGVQWNGAFMVVMPCRIVD